jgi:hypothetical protein
MVLSDLLISIKSDTSFNRCFEKDNGKIRVFFESLISVRIFIIFSTDIKFTSDLNCRRFSCLISKTTCVDPYPSHISGIDIIVKELK